MFRLGLKSFEANPIDGNCAITAVYAPSPDCLLLAESRSLLLCNVIPLPGENPTFRAAGGEARFRAGADGVALRIGGA